MGGMGAPMDAMQATLKGLSGHKDIDSNHSDPQLCASYAADIFQHLRNAEVRVPHTVTHEAWLVRPSGALSLGLCTSNREPSRSWHGSEPQRLWRRRVLFVLCSL